MVAPGTPSHEPPQLAHHEREQDCAARHNNDGDPDSPLGWVEEVTVEGQSQAEPDERDQPDASAPEQQERRREGRDHSDPGQDRGDMGAEERVEVDPRLRIAVLLVDEVRPRPVLDLADRDDGQQERCDEEAEVAEPDAHCSPPSGCLQDSWRYEVQSGGMTHSIKLMHIIS